MFYCPHAKSTAAFYSVLAPATCREQEFSSAADILSKNYGVVFMSRIAL